VIIHIARDVLVVLALIIGRLVFVHFRAYRTCRWCRPGGLIGGSLIARLAGNEPRRRRRRGCWRCHGHRLTRRWGAWHTHKLALALRETWDDWRDRQ